MSPKTYVAWSDAETDTLLEWLSSPDNYRSYCTGVKTRAYIAIANVLETKTKEQVSTSSKLLAGAASRMPSATAASY
jgi:hypothetical protein